MPSAAIPATTIREKKSHTRGRRQYSAAQSFYLTILIILILTACSLAAKRLGSPGQGSNYSRRGVLTFGDNDVYGGNNDIRRRDQEVRFCLRPPC